VIREIVCGLYDMYGVTKILGIQVKHYFVSCSFCRLLVSSHFTPIVVAS
jgi:hypothetical protein